MSETNLPSVLDRFTFSKVGEILLADNRLTFNLKSRSDEVGLVYLWIEVSESTSSVVYVGKAGRTLRMRCMQHKAGFRHSTTGRAHAKRIRSGIAEGKHYELYARKSAMSAIFEESDIPMEGVEELAFIRKFRPSWNASV